MDIDAYEKHIRRLIAEVESLQTRLAVYEPMLVEMLPSWLEYQANQEPASDQAPAEGGSPAADQQAATPPVAPIEGESGQAPVADAPAADAPTGEPGPAAAPEPSTGGEPPTAPEGAEASAPEEAEKPAGGDQPETSGDVPAEAPVAADELEEPPPDAA
ncbi:putative membrane protein [Rhizobium pisi]